MPDAAKHWIIILEPHCVPERKGPFPVDMLAAFVREVGVYRPFDTRTIVLRADADCDILPQDGQEFLDMLGRRRRTVVRRRLESVTRKGGEKVAARLSGRLVRIWSGEHGAYWRKNGCGYTDGKRVWAWALPFEQAFDKTRHCGPEKKIVFEVAL